MTTKRVTLAALEREFGRVSFGSSLEAYRLADEISQKDFAKRLGISKQSLCDLEKGRRLPSIERSIKIAKRLREPVKSWVALALSDMVHAANLKFDVELKASAS